MTVRLIGLPTRETNSSQASLSEGPAQRHTTSFSDKDEYRVGLGGLDICYLLIRVVGCRVPQPGVETKPPFSRDRFDDAFCSCGFDDHGCTLLVKSLSSVCQQLCTRSFRNRMGTSCDMRPLQLESRLSLKAGAHKQTSWWSQSSPQRLVKKFQINSKDSHVRRNKGVIRVR